MAGNIQNVAFANPADQANALIEQQQLARNQQLAAALREQSMADIPANGGRISWTQGLAKLVEGVAANHAQRRADAATWDVTARQQNAQAALHDPSGTAIPQIDTTQNPYRAPETGRSLGQRLKDFIAGGPPVDSSAKALAAGIRATMQNPQAGAASMSLSDPAATFDQSGASAGPAPTLMPPRAPGSPSPTATTAEGQPLQVSSATTGATPQAPLTAPTRAATVAALRSLSPITTAAAPGGAALAAGVRAAAGVPQPSPVANPAYGSGGVDDDGNQAPTMPMSPPPTGAPMQATGASPSSMSAPTSSPPAQAAPPVPPMPQPAADDPMDYSLPASAYLAAMPQRAGSAPDALLPTMPARTGYLLSQMAPDEYWKAVAAAGASIDDVKRLQQSGIDPRSPQGQALLRSAAAKAMQTPLNDDRRGYLTDPYSGQTVAFHPAVPEGTTPTFDARGNVIGATMLPGVADARRQSSAADAMGRAAGEVQEVFDPISGSFRAVPRSTVLGGGAGGGSIDGQLGGKTGPGPAGFQTRPGLGAEAAANASAKSSAAAFQALSDGAADSGNRIYALRQMQQIVADPHVVLGPGSTGAAHLAGFINTVGRSVGLPVSLNANTVTNVAEFNKWASQYGARAAQQLGLSGSDARMNLTVAATPNGHMPNGALQRIIPQVIGLEVAQAAKSAAGARWTSQNGNAGWQQFGAQWTRNYDPRLYTVQQLPPAEQQRFFRSLPPADRRDLAQKAATLKSMGAYQ